jgi:hypothetical protein
MNKPVLTIWKDCDGTVMLLHLSLLNQQCINVKAISTSVKPQASILTCALEAYSTTLKFLYRNGSWHCMYSAATRKGLAAINLAKDISVTQKSAWFLLHRLRYAFDHPNFQNTLGNIVEVDETFVGGKAVNKHTENKKEEK